MRRRRRSCSVFAGFAAALFSAALFSFDRAAAALFSFVLFAAARTGSRVVFSGFVFRTPCSRWPCSQLLGSRSPSSQRPCFPSLSSRLTYSLQPCLQSLWFQPFDSQRLYFRRLCSPSPSSQLPYSLRFYSRWPSSRSPCLGIVRRCAPWAATTPLPENSPGLDVAATAGRP